MKKPSCPTCVHEQKMSGVPVNGRKHVIKTNNGTRFYCTLHKSQISATPNEGGTYHNNPSRRLEEQERLEERRRLGR